MKSDALNVFSGSSIPLSIVMEKEQTQQGRWSFPRWQVLGVVVGKDLNSQPTARKLVHSDEQRQQFLWSGFTLQLFKDSAESYWYNLVGNKPSLFIVCRQEDNEDMSPLLVTANYDEAGAHMETDDMVFSVDMPAEVYQWLERYVVENYVPQQKKKRKRERWAKD